jgi:hypothetical protein
MEIGKDTRIVEGMVLLGALNGFIFSLRSNPDSKYYESFILVMKSFFSIIMEGPIIDLTIILLILLPMILLIAGIFYVHRFGGFIGIAAVITGFACGYTSLIGDYKIPLVLLAAGIAMGLYGVRTKRIEYI